MPPELHPLTEKYPPMEADEFAAFKADLAEHGQKNPIWLFEGKVLDGRNRLRACLELGLDPVFAEFAGTEAEAEAFVDSQNLHRRHLTRELRQKLAVELRTKGLSARVIAQQLGCGETTVRRDLLTGGESDLSEPLTTNRNSVAPNGATESAVDDAEARRNSVAPNGATESAVEEAETKPEVRQTLKPPIEPARVKGRDGKSYRAQKPVATKPKPAPNTSAPQPVPHKPKPAPPAKAQWAELASILSELAQKVETLVPTPEENEKPWELISSLEKTAQALNRQAQRLRRRHHL
jgi:hypothetical protein